MTKSGQSVIEVILAASIFMIITTGMIGLVVQGLRANRLGAEETIASFYTVEGMEAVRSIKNRSFSNLVSSTGIGLTQTGGIWAFGGTTNTFDKYTRTIGITEVFRDAAGNILSVGGTLDPNSKKVTVSTSWNFGPSRTNSVNLVSYFTDWRKAISGGMLVYGDGGTTNDSIKYKILNDSNWDIASTLVDVDAGTSNRYLRAVRVFSSPTRDEKIVISRHYNGSVQSIYMQVFNGAAWGNLSVGASWSSTSYLDVQNFDGAYLANGNFIAVYSDNTTTPKYKTWNGTTWSSSASTQNIGGIPNFITLKTRPQTNELMAVFFDQSSDTNSQYFYNNTWTLHTEHAAASPVNTKKLVDFDWSPSDTTKGALIFSNAANDRRLHIKIFTANGTGGGSWGTTANAPLIGGGANRLGAMDLTARGGGTTEYLACDKDSSNNINCYRSNGTPTWSTPTNNTIVTGTQNGIQQSFDSKFVTSGTLALTVYSDNTATAKYKTYNPSTNAFSASSSNIGTFTGTVATVRLIPNPSSNDIMILMADTALDVYTALWDGSTSTVKNFSPQSINGSVLTDFWYDFAWN